VNTNLYVIADFAILGAAGIHWILNEYVEASDKYREILQLASKHEHIFTTDTLQVSISPPYSNSSAILWLGSFRINLNQKIFEFFFFKF